MLDLQSPEFVKGLKHLKLISDKKFAGQRVGERKTKRKGSSVEFKDFREYNPGDDIRFIDWNLWGRLDRYYIKLFHNEENLNVFFLWDTSSSLAYGSPSKWNFSMELIATITYLALHNKDSVYYYPILDKIFTGAPRGNQPGFYPKLSQFLQSMKPSGHSNLRGAIDQFLRYEKRKGMLFLISDFFVDQSEMEYVFKKLSFYGHEVVPVLVLSPDEVDPPFHGHCKLQDLETSEWMELDLSNEYLTMYQETVEQHKNNFLVTANKYRCKPFFAVSDQSSRDFVVDILRRS